MLLPKARLAVELLPHLPELGGQDAGDDRNANRIELRCRPTRPLRTTAHE
jgi:hypothetical protein